MSSKRKADTDAASMDTDKIVKEALRDVEERKKAKKQAQTGDQAMPHRRAPASLLPYSIQSIRFVKRSTEGHMVPAGIPAKDPSKKGKTLQELEQEEGGTIKESQVPMAQLKRAEKRKGKGQMGGMCHICCYCIVP